MVFEIFHVFSNGPSTSLRTGKILAMDYDPSAGGRGICRVVYIDRDVVEVERNCTSVGEKDPIIALRSN